MLLSKKKICEHANPAADLNRMTNVVFLMKKIQLLSKHEIAFWYSTNICQFVKFLDFMLMMAEELSDYDAHSVIAI